MHQPKTVDVQIGRKLSDKSKEEIMMAVFDCFNLYGVIAVQIGYDIVRVSFTTEAGFKHAMENTGVRLFGLWCPILGGGPPVTILHIFDYPFEEDDADIRRVCSDFGEVKNVKKQKYISNPNVYTGTRLVSVALSSSPPRFLTIGGYLCRVWYRGQPLVCNLCAVQGHKSADCPNKDKCRRCGASGHFAHNCTNAWGTGAAGVTNLPAEQTPAVSDPAPEYTSLASITEAAASAAVGPSDEDPPVAHGDSGELGTSSSDGYLFTCGQPMSEDAVSDPVEVSDSQCVAAEACVTAAQCENDAEAQNENDVLETVVDEGGACPASPSILQNVEPAVVSNPESVSLESSSDLSPLSYGTRELKTKAKSVVGKFLQRNRPSPVSVAKPPARAGGPSLQRSGSHSSLPVVVANRPPLRSRSKKT